MTFIPPIQEIHHSDFINKQLRVFIKRDDLIHPIISGNKWRKLKYNIEHAKQQGFKGILSFGGAYSNHIHALAYAAKENNISCIGMIRGEEHYQYNATLSQAIDWGMKCHFVDRKTYRLRNDTNYLIKLQKKFPDYFIVPEGGSNPLALTGVEEVITELNQQLTYDTLIVPVGSGGTLAGLIRADNNQHELLGIAVLKGAESITQQMVTLLSGKPSTGNTPKKWQLLDGFHRGGYAKFSKQDEERIYRFSQATGILFEPVYSGKMLLALLDLIAQDYFKPQQKIVMLHTGGLQGINGLIEQNKLHTPLSLKNFS